MIIKALTALMFLVVGVANAQEIFPIQTAVPTLNAVVINANNPTSASAIADGVGHVWSFGAVINTQFGGYHVLEDGVAQDTPATNGTWQLRRHTDGTMYAMDLAGDQWYHWTGSAWTATGTAPPVSSTSGIQMLLGVYPYQPPLTDTTTLATWLGRVPDTIGGLPQGPAAYFSLDGFFPPAGIDGWPLDITYRTDVCTNSSGNVYCPTVSISVDHTSVTNGSPIHLNWGAADLTSCVGTNFSTGAGNPPNSTSPGVSVTPPSNAITTYSVTCTGSGSGSSTVSIPVTAGISGSGGPGFNSKSYAADFAGIAAGHYDALMTQQMQTFVLPHASQIYYARFNSEWEGDFWDFAPFFGSLETAPPCNTATGDGFGYCAYGAGTVPPSVWIAALQHAITVFRNVVVNGPGGNPNIKIQFDAPYDDVQAQYYPGDAYVDILGSDLYIASTTPTNSAAQFRANMNATGGFESNAYILTFAQKHNKPVVYPEWCDASTSPNQVDTTMITLFDNLFASVNGPGNSAIIAGSYWDHPASSGGYQCDFTTDPVKQSAFAQAWPNGFQGTSYAGTFFNHVPMPVPNPWQSSSGSSGGSCSGTSPTVSVNNLTPTAGSTINVSFCNGPGNQQDFVQLVLDPNKNYVGNFVYLNGAKSGTVQLTVPVTAQDRPAGYAVAFNSNNSFTTIAQSAHITVPATLSPAAPTATLPTALAADPFTPDHTFTVCASGCNYSLLGDALTAASSLDNVLIKISSGDYVFPSDYAVIFNTPHLWIKGIGTTMPHLYGLGSGSQNILNTSQATCTGSTPTASFTMDNLELGPWNYWMVNSHDCITFTMRNSYLHDAPQGMITGNTQHLTLNLYNDVFARNGGGNGPEHDIYVGEGDYSTSVVNVVNSVFESPIIGHAFKERAANLNLDCSIFTVDQDTTYEGSETLDASYAGAINATHNLFATGGADPAWSSNNSFDTVRYGFEAGPPPFSYPNTSTPTFTSNVFLDDDPTTNHDFVSMGVPVTPTAPITWSGNEFVWATPQAYVPTDGGAIFYYTPTCCGSSSRWAHAGDIVLDGSNSIFTSRAAAGMPARSAYPLGWRDLLPMMPASCTDPVGNVKVPAS